MALKIQQLYRQVLLDNDRLVENQAPISLFYWLTFFLKLSVALLSFTVMVKMVSSLYLIKQNLFKCCVFRMEYGRRNKTAFRIQVEKGKLMFCYTPPRRPAILGSFI